MTYEADFGRYDAMSYRRCGNSGLLLPALSLGLWSNFGVGSSLETQATLLRMAFDAGITHFDLANNYGPPAGEAERHFGIHFQRDFRTYRNEMIISTKAGHRMWEGPYGDWGSRKYLLSSLDESLQRMQLEYVDIFYHHRPDPHTPLEETMSALADAVRQGKALYVGISKYSPEQTVEAVHILRRMGVRCLIHQFAYSMLRRDPENGLLDALDACELGSIAFSPLQRGILTGKYLNGVPEDSRAVTTPQNFNAAELTQETAARLRALQEVAASRGQTLAQLALSWVLRNGRVNSALIGASRPEQLRENLDALRRLDFSPEELERIDAILAGPTA